ncbi:MAG: hypothetical protein OEZ36_07025 [Spirochaetota bacterium]|nr:hypothetical protein [Spirochaetota bacterium]
MAEMNELVGPLSRDMSVAELLKAEIFNIRDVKEKDVLLLKEAFNIKNIEDLADLKFVAWAQNFQKIEKSGKSVDTSQFENQLIKAYEKLSIKEILQSPVFALQGLSENDARLLKIAFNVETVLDLACSPPILKAQEIVARHRKKNRSLLYIGIIIFAVAMVLAVSFL